MSIAFLFDIDGCLTFPNLSKSVLDIDLVDRIFIMFKRGIPIAFVTGRSKGWLKKQYEINNRLNYFEIPTYIEYGLVYMINGSIKFQEPSGQFIPLREEMIGQLAIIAQGNNIFFEPSRFYVDYPDHESMWIEEKFVQLSIAGGAKVSTKRIHQMGDEAWINYRRKVRIINHHLGVDVIPLNWSKSQAIAHFINQGGVHESKFQWYVFGDLESDREMQSGLTNSVFVSTKSNASKDVRQALSTIESVSMYFQESTT